MTLENRFKSFLDTLEDVENIDNLTLTQEQRNANKADYFAKNRNLIIELKSLETDTEQKLEKILLPHRSRPEFPEVWGGQEVYKILKHLPDGDDINTQ
jgi:Uma2 family endonuclease